MSDKTVGILFENIVSIVVTKFVVFSELQRRDPFQKKGQEMTGRSIEIENTYHNIQNKKRKRESSSTYEYFVSDGKEAKRRMLEDLTDDWMPEEKYMPPPSILETLSD